VPPPGEGIPPGNGSPPPGYGGYGTYGGYSGYGGGGPYSGSYGYGVPPAPKPGIIPLRPLSAGEILSGAVNAIKWNPGTILGASAIVSVVSGAAMGLVTFVLVRNAFASVSASPLGNGTVEVTPHQVGTLFGAAFALLGVTVLFTAFANIVLTGGLSVAVGQAVLGRKEMLGRAWRSTSRRIGALLAVVLLEALSIALGWMAAAALSIGAAVLLAKGMHLVAVGVLVGVLGVLTATVFAAIIAVRWSLAIPVVMLERKSALASLGRSWQLVRGSAWRAFGIIALTQIIISFVSGVISTPFSIAGGGAFFFSPLVTHPTGGSEFISALGSIVAGAITTPMVAGVIVLLYADLRMRKEGLAGPLQSAAHAQASPDGREINPW
jgi:hypothetical protein